MSSVSLLKPAFESAKRAKFENIASVTFLSSHIGLNICAVWTCVMHTGYFLLSAVLLSFLQCPTFSRLSLIVTVPLNAVAEVNQQPAFDLCTLTALLFALSLGGFLCTIIMRMMHMATF